jgi:DNA modification methylase
MKNQLIPQLIVVYLSIHSLAPNPRNARTHSKRQIRQIAASIKAFGFTNPVLIDRQNRIIAGHGRVEAAKLLGIEQIPTILLENMTEDQIRAYILADNRLAEMAGWDKSILAIELQYLISIDEIDVTITGFEIPVIDQILVEARDEQDIEDVVEIDETAQAVTQTSDLWKLGKHRVLCGNALQESSFAELMGPRRANIAFADPPYNVRIDQNVCGKGAIHHREFPMATGEMSEAEFIAFLTAALGLLARYSTSASVHFICMCWRHMHELLAAGNQIYDEFLNLCVWVKNNGGMGSLYRSRHELVFVFRNGKGSHRNNVMLGQYKRNRTNVWEYPGINTFARQGDEGNLLALHPTVKPVALVADALLDCSARGNIVLDSFLGSGTTLIAAERVGRVCYGIEIDPLYVDVAIRRWQRHTGDRAIHAASGKCFDEIAAGLEVPSER